MAKCHDLQSADAPDPEEQRELEARAAGLKAANTWHASRAIHVAREACGGAGYMAENRLIALRADTDVFTTFEGDNHVLTQLVAKQLLTAYADDISSMSPVAWVRFAAVARRLQAKTREMSEFDAFNAVQDHVLHAVAAHIDRVVLEAFVAGIDSCPDPQARDLLESVCDLYALSVIEADKAWYIEHRCLSTDRAKAVTRGINDRCRKLRPHAQTLIDGFGIPEELHYAEMLHPENLPD